MTITRTLTVLSLTIAALLSSGNDAKADRLQDAFRTVRRIQADFGGGPQHSSPGYGQPQHPGFGYPRPGCERPPCPPPAPRCVYCVYYYDCHCGWKLYGCYHSQCSATSAERSLQHQGYRTYIKVKHVDGGYPAGSPGGPVLNRR